MDAMHLSFERADSLENVYNEHFQSRGIAKLL